jgi:hypothetical protein
MPSSSSRSPSLAYIKTKWVRRALVLVTMPVIFIAVFLCDFLMTVMDTTADCAERIHNTWTIE